jgi:hypothetical protein
MVLAGAPREAATGIRHTRVVENRQCLRTEALTGP